MGFHNVWAQKISITPPPYGKSLEIPRGRGVQRQKFPRDAPFPEGEET